MWKGRLGMPLYAEKLDWLLCSAELEALERGRGNLDLTMSDHAYLWVDVACRQPR